MNIRNIVAGFIGLFLLVGCAQMMAQQRVKEIQTKFLAARDVCKQRYEQGTYKTYTERTKCLNDSALQIAVEAEYPYLDLVVLGNAYRASLAKRIDDGFTNETDASLLQAQLGTLIAQEEQKRNALAIQVRSEQQRAQAASVYSVGSILQGMAVYQQSLQPRMPVTCIQTGNIVTCN
ncbi:MAG: hypothetical protein Q8Q81_03795 [Oxalobacteraceae bacterium]|nr:hypothetical protein [Oxalobacteraceae bacterium]